MNVLILTTHLNRGGIGRYVINLAKGLTLRGHRVLIASGGGDWVDKLSDLDIRHKKIPIKTKSIFSLKILRSYLELRELIADENIEIVHCNTRVTQSLGNFIYKKLKVPYVSAYHGFYQPKIWRTVFPFSGARSIAVSQAVKTHLVEDFQMNPDKIDVVYNGIEVEKYKSGPSRREHFGFKTNDILLGILGRISQEKGQLLAIEAMNEIVKRYDNVYLLISGSGKKEQEAKELVKKYSLGLKVKFLNIDSEVFLDTINILLAPSSKEGFGFSLIEAFAKERPVIGYNVGGIAEIVDDRKNGLLFNHYIPSSLVDAIEEIISSPELVLRLVEQAKVDVLKFSLQNMAVNTKKLIGKY